MATKTSDYHHSQQEAVRAARDFIWQGAPFARRENVTPKTHPEFAYFDDRGLPVLAVTAQINNHLFVIHFDGYGRTREGAHQIVKVS